MKNLEKFGVQELSNVEILNIIGGEEDWSILGKLVEIIVEGVVYDAVKAAVIYGVENGSGVPLKYYK